MSEREKFCFQYFAVNQHFYSNEPKKIAKISSWGQISKKTREKYIFDDLQLTADNKNTHSSRVIYYSANESWWNLPQKSEKFWGGVEVGNGSNFALKFLYWKKCWIFFHFDPLKSLFSAWKFKNRSFIQDGWFQWPLLFTKIDEKILKIHEKWKILFILK